MSFGGKICFPVFNSKHVQEGEFTYPALFSNYQSQYGGSFSIDYKITQTIQAGVAYHFISLIKFNHDFDEFHLVEPTSEFHVFAPFIYYELTHQWSILPDKLSYGFRLSPELVCHQLSYSDNTIKEVRNVGDMGVKEAEGVSEWFSALQLAALFRYPVSNNLGFYGAIEGAWYITGQNLYLDRRFIQIGFDLGIYFRLFRNRYYFYE